MQFLLNKYNVEKDNIRLILSYFYNNLKINQLLNNFKIKI